MMGENVGDGRPMGAAESVWETFWHSEGNLSGKIS